MEEEEAIGLIAMRQVLSSLLDDACLHIPKINNAVKRIEGLKMLLYMKRDVAKVKLKEVIAQLQQNTAGLKDKIESEIDEKTMEKERKMKSEKERLVEHIRSVAAECSTVEELLETGKEGVLLQQGTLVAERLEALIRRNITAHLDDMNYLELVFQRSRSEEHLRSTKDCVYVRTGILDPQTMHIVTLDGSPVSQAFCSTEEIITIVTNDREHIKNGHQLIVVEITDPRLQSLEFHLTDNEDGTYTIRYTPRVVGAHSVSVTVYGSHIIGSPQQVLVTEPTVSGTESQTASENGSPCKTRRHRISRNFLSEVKKHIAQNPPVKPCGQLFRPMSAHADLRARSLEPEESSGVTSPSSKDKSLGQRRGSCHEYAPLPPVRGSRSWNDVWRDNSIFSQHDTSRSSGSTWSLKGTEKCDSQNTGRPHLLDEVCSTGRTDEARKTLLYPDLEHEGTVEKEPVETCKDSSKNIQTLDLGPLSASRNISPTPSGESRVSTRSSEPLPRNREPSEVNDTVSFLKSDLLDTDGSLVPKNSTLRTESQTDLLWDEETTEITSSDSGMGKTASSPSTPGLSILSSTSSLAPSLQPSPVCASSPKTLHPQKPGGSQPEEDLWLTAKELVKQSQAKTNTKATAGERVEAETNPEATAGDRVDPDSGDQTQPRGSVVCTTVVENHLRKYPGQHPALKAKYVKRIGRKGCGRKELMMFPLGVTVNPVNRDILICDNSNNMLKCFKWENGVHRFTVGDSLESGCVLSRPSAVVTNSVGDIFVKDSHTINVLDKDGKHLRTINTPRLQRPYGLDITSCGDLIVLDHGGAQPLLLRFRQDGTLVGKNAYLPICGAQRTGAKCRFMAIDRDLQVIFSDLGKSKMYTTDMQGRTLVKFGFYGCQPGEFREPSGVACDGQGNILVADSKNNRIKIFRGDGTFHGMLELSTEILRPSDIHLTSDGHLLVCNYLDHCVKVFKLESL